ncbi:MAG TPA: 2-amino-4-hydroxy-6-hydroxymethyldihydropteridine diphosphokinase [Bacteroidales bacterium]|nr:2-amino-4-hydroxy-6-hydroxymethyldihydropteridine diphosphokinase [Bacteroidales bacterium]
MAEVYLSLGSNIGDRLENINLAIDYINENIGEVICCSSVYETEAWGINSSGMYLNQVILIKSNIKPISILEKIWDIESKLGRVRVVDNKYADRTIDIDILFYDNHVIHGDYVTIPHPMLQHRRFVLVPLCDIAADFVHPELNKKVADLLQVCKDDLKVQKFDPGFN